MPLRTRIKRAFTRSSQSSDSGSLSKSSSRRDSNVYQPGEKMPPMKYRRPVNPQHKEKLEAFSFAKAWRRKSDQSQYSPMGSRMPSRKNSTTTTGRKSFQAARSGPPRTMSAGAGVDAVEQVREGPDEEADVANVGLSRQQTRESSKAPRSFSFGRRSQSFKSGGSRPGTRGASASGSGSTKTEQPFTPEDLELALKKSRLDAPQEESDGTPTAPTPATVRPSHND